MSTEGPVFRVCEVTKTSFFTVFHSLGRSQFFVGESTVKKTVVFPHNFVTYHLSHT